jgi:hypothetical protein
MSKKFLIENDDGTLIDIHADNKKKLLTEDLGKQFEMAICLLYETHYDGKFKYSMKEPEELKNRIIGLKQIYPYKLIHTAKGGARYDFTCVESPDIKLSAKTTKNKGVFKVCPQVIGQPSKKKFCEYFGLENNLINQEIKEYIQKNIEKILEKYFEYTFDCPIIFYNKGSSILWFIKNNSKIDWNDCIIEFSHIKRNKEWNESTTIFINGHSMGEFQFHNHRDNIKFRWNMYNLLYCFHHGENEKYFEIIDLNTMEKKL